RYCLADLNRRTGRDDVFLRTLADAIEASPAEYAHVLEMLDRAASTPEARVALGRAADSLVTDSARAVPLALLRSRLASLNGQSEIAGTILEQSLASVRRPDGTLDAAGGPVRIVLANRRLGDHRWDDAIELCRAAEKSEFKHVSLYSALATALEANDDFDGAEAACRDVIRIAPKHVASRLRLAELQ